MNSYAKPTFGCCDAATLLHSGLLTPTMAEAAGSGGDVTKQQLEKVVAKLRLRNKQIERLEAAHKKLQAELDDRTEELRRRKVSKSKRKAPLREKQQARIDELTREVRMKSSVTVGWQHLLREVCCGLTLLCGCGGWAWDPQNERLRKKIDGDRLRSQGQMAALEVDLSTVTQQLTSGTDEARRAYEKDRTQLRERTEQLHGELTRAVGSLV